MKAILTAGLLLSIVLLGVLWWTESEEIPALDPPAAAATPVERASNLSGDGSLPATSITTVPFAPDAGRAVEQPANAKLKPRVTTIAGLVVDQAGEPVKGANVGVFRITPQGPRSRAFLVTRADASGGFAFTFEMSAAREYLIVARLSGQSPGSQSVRMLPGQSREGVRIVLTDGQAIEGTVSVAGIPVPEVSVSLDVAYGVAGLFLEWGEETWWDQGEIQAKRATVRTDTRGRYRISGLSPRKYRLEVSGFPNGACHPDVSRIRFIEAPTQAGDMELDMARLSIGVTDGLNILQDAQVSVVSEASGKAWESSTSKGRVAVHVAPGSILRVRAVSRGFLLSEVQVQPLAVGAAASVDVILKKIDMPDVVLTLLGSAQLDLKEVAVRLIPTSSVPESKDPLKRRMLKGLRARRAQGEDFHLRDVPADAGNYSLVALPASFSSYLLPASTELFLPETGTVHVFLNAALGGRAAIDLMDGQGRFLSGRWILRNAEGNTVLSRAITVASGGFRYAINVMAGSFRGPGDPLESARRAAGVLPPGAYQVEARGPGVETVHRKIRVVPGKLASVKIVLKKRGG